MTTGYTIDEITTIIANTVPSKYYDIFTHICSEAFSQSNPLKMSFISDEHYELLTLVFQLKVSRADELVNKFKAMCLQMYYTMEIGNILDDTMFKINHIKARNFSPHIDKIREKLFDKGITLSVMENKEELKQWQEFTLNNCEELAKEIVANVLQEKQLLDDFRSSMISSLSSNCVSPCLPCAPPTTPNLDA